LHGAPVRLSLPAFELRAVVLKPQCDAPAQHKRCSLP
jgi:hypothetical protein